MTKLYLNPAHLDKWLYQNKEIYTGDFVEGCLLDNFLVWTKRGVAAVYEHYVNANSSDYVVYVAAQGSPEYDQIFEDFYKFDKFSR